MSITSCSLGFSPSMFMAWQRNKISGRSGFLDLLQPVLVHCAGSDAGFKSVEHCGHINQLLLSETVGMAGQLSWLIVPDRKHATSNVKGKKTNDVMDLKKISLKFECFYFTGSTLSYLCRQGHQFSSEHRTDQWSLAWRSSSWFGFDQFFWNQFFSHQPLALLWLLASCWLQRVTLFHRHCWVFANKKPISSHHCNCVNHGTSFYIPSFLALQDNS